MGHGGNPQIGAMRNQRGQQRREEIRMRAARSLGRRNTRKITFFLDLAQEGLDGTRNNAPFDECGAVVVGGVGVRGAPAVSN